MTLMFKRSDTMVCLTNCRVITEEVGKQQKHTLKRFYQDNFLLMILVL